MFFVGLLYNIYMTKKCLKIRSILAKNLKEQRNKLGYTQEKFAEVSGLSIQTINDIEGGRKWVSDKTITKLAETLNMECYQLLVPEYTRKNKSEVNQTKHLLGLMKKVIKSVDTSIEEEFTDFLKSKITQFT